MQAFFGAFACELAWPALPPFLLRLRTLMRLMSCDSMFQ